MITKVIFRTFRDSGDVIALFPQIPSDPDGLYCESYQHVGQHGGASSDYLSDITTLSTPEEYGVLLHELEQIGYTDLKICARSGKTDRIKRWDEAHKTLM
jgi:hypothetical protein